MSTLTAIPEAPVTVYYCKAGIQSGRTIRLLQHGQVHEAARISLTHATASMAHDNSTGRPKRSGARCVLIVTTGYITYA